MTAEIFLKQVVFEKKKGHSQLGPTYLILFSACRQFPGKLAEPTRVSCTDCRNGR